MSIFPLIQNFAAVEVLMLRPYFFVIFPIFPFQKIHESLIFYLFPNRKASFKIKRKGNSLLTLNRNLDPGEHKANSWKIIITQLLNANCPFIGFWGNFWRIYPPMKYADACVLVLSYNTVLIMQFLTCS